MAYHKSHIGPTITKRQAERILDNDMKTKEFWTYDLDDNLLILQNVLDILFNCLEGNRYKADVLESQTVCRLIVKCLVCNKDLSSYDPLKNHNDGKLHKKAVQQSITCEDPNLLSKPAFKPLNKEKNKFAEGSLEDRLDKTSHRIIGMSFLYKEVKDDQEYFSCQLCLKLRCSANKIFDHLTSDKHRRNYVEVAFPSKINEDLDLLIDDIEMQEGRIHHSIIILKNSALDDLPTPKMHIKRSPPSSPLTRSSSPPLPKEYDGIERISKSTSIEEFVEELKAIKNSKHHPELMSILNQDVDEQEVAVEAIKCLSDKLFQYATFSDKELVAQSKRLRDKTQQLQSLQNREILY